MSSKYNPVNKIGKCTPLVIQIPGIQGTGISQETITEREKQDITNRILSPVQEDAKNAKKFKDEAQAAKDRSEKIARDVTLVIGDWVGTVDQHLPHDFGIQGEDDTTVELPIGGTIETVANNIETVKAVGSSIEDVKKVADGIGSIPEIAPYTEEIAQVAPYVQDIQSLAPYASQIQIVSQNEEALQAIANTLGLSVDATTLAPGSSASVTKEVTPEGYKLTFNIPRGAKGDRGEKGETGSLTTVTVTAVQLPAGSPPTVSQTESVLTLGIPKGDQGVKGEKGDTGNCGVYVGSDSPEGYNLYIDPSGDWYCDYYSKEEMDEKIKEYINKLARNASMFDFSRAFNFNLGYNITFQELT